MVVVYYQGSPGRALQLTEDFKKGYFLKADTAREYDTIIEQDLTSHTIPPKEFVLPELVWSMAYSKKWGCCYSLSLQGQLFKLDPTNGTVTEQKLEFPHPEYKSSFSTVACIDQYVIVVGYLKTPKEDDNCPNRMFILDGQMNILGQCDLELNGKIFCRHCPDNRFHLPHQINADGHREGNGMLYPLQRQGIRTAITLLHQIHWRETTGHRET